MYKTCSCTLVHRSMPVQMTVQDGASCTQVCMYVCIHVCDMWNVIIMQSGCAFSFHVSGRKFSQCFLKEQKWKGRTDTSTYGIPGRDLQYALLWSHRTINFFLSFCFMYVLEFEAMFYYFPFLTSFFGARIINPQTATVCSALPHINPFR